ncbi:hypothetical protein D3C80_1285800 [compost metagenome]
MGRLRYRLPGLFHGPGGNRRRRWCLLDHHERAQLGGLRAHTQIWHRAAKAAVPRAFGQRVDDRGLRADRTPGGFRRQQPEDPCAPGWRPLHTQRQQAVHYVRAERRCGHRLRRHRPGGRQAWHHCVHRANRHTRLPGSACGGQTRPACIRHLPDRLRQCARACRQPAGRRRAGLQDRPGQPGGGAYRHCFAVGRDGPRRLRGGARLCQRTAELRQTTDRAPGRGLPPGRYGHAHCRGPADGAARRRAA